MFRDQMLEEIYQIRSAVQEKAPLIHCITNPISIHDCANVVLAAGGRPMMAEHPAEVEEITATARALALNLGNITDARKASILIAGKAAMRREIPVILDMVGIGCSHFRKEITEEFLGQRIPGAPLILKGNMSELKALAGGGCSVSGVGCGPEGCAFRDEPGGNDTAGKDCGEYLGCGCPCIGENGSGNRWQGGTFD